MKNNTELFDRNYKLIATKGTEKREYTGLKVEFKCEVFGDSKLNKTEISLTNCNQESRAFFEAEKYETDIELYAGYNTDIGLIFKGSVEYLNDRDGQHKTGFKGQRQQSHLNDGDWITTFTIKDGIKQTKNKIFTMSLKDNVSVSSIINTLSGKMGLDKGTINTKGLNKQYKKGYVASGNASQHFFKIANQYGYNAKIQKGSIYFWKIGTPFSDESILLDHSSGLIGSPEKTESGLKVRSLIRHEFDIGRLVEIKSLYNQGFYIINKVVHLGDNFGENWFSDLELIKYDK